VKQVLLIALLFAAGAAEGQILITNDARGITAYRGGQAILSISAKPLLHGVIEEAARANGVDPRLIAAVATRESANNPNAVSRAGACGIMQLMPATARLLGVTNIFDVRENVFGGARYLRALLDTFNGDLDLTLAAYNAGPAAVQKYGGVPPYAETLAYVKAVRGAYEAMR